MCPIPNQQYHEIEEIVSMTIAGVILLIVGGVMSTLLFTGNAPAAISNLPVPFWAWVVVAAIGAVLIYFNRRPAN